jgi:hypothetical protein
MITTFIAAVTLIVSLLAPSNAIHNDRAVKKLVAWAGCNATVMTSDQQLASDSMFSLQTKTLYIGTRPDAPTYAERIIILHEIGHCLQLQEGGIAYFQETGAPGYELDADMRSADLACKLGMDGRRMLHDTMIWAKHTFGYEGDWVHGSLADRIAQGDNAPACKAHATQAP